MPFPLKPPAAADRHQDRRVASPPVGATTARSSSAPNSGSRCVISPKNPFELSAPWSLQRRLKAHRDRPHIFSAESPCRAARSPAPASSARSPCPAWDGRRSCSSSCVVKMRTRTPSARSIAAALRSMNVVSERLNSRAMACIRSVVRPHVFITTASGLPASGSLVKTSTTK